MKNNSRPIIGILGVPTYDDEKDNLIALYSDYKNAIVKKDCIPFMICPLADVNYVQTKLSEIPELTEQEKNLYEEMVELCDGIIIPGGYKMYPFQQYVVECAIKKDLPVLGICMGMQLLANIDNKENSLQINETTINHRQKEIKYVHKVNILPNTILSKIICQNEIDVNSKHRYHVTKVTNFQISAVSEDGLIEGIELPDKKFVIGVQWHPEKMISYDENANKIFDEFVKKMGW